MTQMVPAHGDIAPGAENAAGRAQDTRGRHDQGHDDDGAGRALVAGPEQWHPDQDSEQEPEDETSKGEELNQRAEPQPMNGCEQHQADDQQIHPIHRSEGIGRCARKDGPTAIVVPPCLPAPCLDTGVSGHALAACPSCSLRSRSPGRAARDLTRAHPGHRMSSESRKVRHSRSGNRLRPVPANSLPCLAPPPGDAGRWASPDPIRPGAAVGTTVIVSTTNGGVSWKAQHVAGGSTPTAQRSLVPHCDRLHGGRVERSIAARERRRRDDRRRRQDLGTCSVPDQRTRCHQCRVHQHVQLHRHRQRRHADVVGAQRRFRKGRQQERGLPALLPAANSSRASPVARASSPGTSQPATATVKARSH